MLRKRKGEGDLVTRYEAKYAIPRDLVPQIRAFIQPFCKPDPNAHGSPPTYRITTLQLEDSRYSLHYAKEFGALTRFKLRVRTYDDIGSTPIYPEIKAKLGETIVKTRTMVPIKAIADVGYLFDGWVGTASTNPEPLLFTCSEPITLTARFRPANTPAYQPTAYEIWSAENYTEQEILATGAAAPNAPSGITGYSNYALFALGGSRYHPLAPEQLAARARLTIEHRTDGLWLSHFKTPADYQILTTTSLVVGAWQVWPPHQTTTNLPNELIEHKAPGDTPHKFFKWQILLP